MVRLSSVYVNLLTFEINFDNHIIWKFFLPGVCSKNFVRFCKAYAWNPTGPAWQWLRIHGTHQCQSNTPRAKQTKWQRILADDYNASVCQCSGLYVWFNLKGRTLTVWAKLEWSKLDTGWIENVLVPSWPDIAVVSKQAGNRRSSASYVITGCQLLWS